MPDSSSSASSLAAENGIDCMRGKKGTLDSSPNAMTGRNRANVNCHVAQDLALLTKIRTLIHEDRRLWLASIEKRNSHRHGPWVTHWRVSHSPDPSWQTLRIYVIYRIE